MNTTDQRIDHLLHVLGAASASNGLEQRVHARLAQHVESRERTPSRFKRAAGILGTPGPTQLALWLSVAAAVIVIEAGPFFHLVHIPSQLVTQASAPVLHAHLPSVQQVSPARIISHGRTVASLPQTVAEGPQSSSVVNDDPDAVALAETFAPSHAAPSMPLSAQETAMSQSIQRGALVEVAMFDARYEPAASALASARERASVREYIHGLLGPLAIAQALTSSSPRPEDVPTVTDPEPPSVK